MDGETKTAFFGLQVSLIGLFLVAAFGGSFWVWLAGVLGFLVGSIITIGIVW